jgi:hypothetical protein
MTSLTTEKLRAGGEKVSSPFLRLSRRLSIPGRCT